MNFIKIIIFKFIYIISINYRKIKKIKMKEENEYYSEEISFTAPPSKHGNYYIFHIPNKLIKSGEINPQFYYKIRIKPIKRRNKLGKDAEIFILNELRRKYKEDENNVIRREIGKGPYELVLNKDDTEYFIAVKSIGSDIKMFTIDEKLLEFAKEKGDKFILYHVINFATNNPTYVEFENFYDQYISERFVTKNLEAKSTINSKENEIKRNIKLFY